MAAAAPDSSLDALLDRGASGSEGPRASRAERRALHTLDVITPKEEVLELERRQSP